VTLESQTYTAAGAAGDNAKADPEQQQKQPGGRRAKRGATRRGGPLKALRRAWLPIVIILVVLLAAFGVYRLHGVFGKTETTRPGSGLANDTKPFNPKTVVYEIYGPPGTVATINYLDLDAQPQIARDVTLPWSLTLTTTAPAASANIVAQGDSDTIGCRITVNGELKDEKTNTGVSAQTFCLVKSA
jgi:Mycobacterium membrane protein